MCLPLGSDNRLPESFNKNVKRNYELFCLDFCEPFQKVNFGTLQRNTIFCEISGNQSWLISSRRVKVVVGHSPPFPPSL